MDKALEPIATKKREGAYEMEGKKKKGHCQEGDNINKGRSIGAFSTCCEMVEFG